MQYRQLTTKCTCNFKFVSLSSVSVCAVCFMKQQVKCICYLLWPEWYVCEPHEFYSYEILINFTSGEVIYRWSSHHRKVKRPSLKKCRYQIRCIVLQAIYKYFSFSETVIKHIHAICEKSVEKNILSLSSWWVLITWMRTEVDHENIVYLSAHHKLSQHCLCTIEKVNVVSTPY